MRERSGSTLSHHHQQRLFIHTCGMWYVWNVQCTWWMNLLVSEGTYYSLWSYTNTSQGGWEIGPSTSIRKTTCEGGRGSRSGEQNGWWWFSSGWWWFSRGGERVVRGRLLHSFISHWHRFIFDENHPFFGNGAILHADCTHNDKANCPLYSVSWSFGLSVCSS